MLELLYIQIHSTAYALRAAYITTRPMHFGWTYGSINYADGESMRTDVVEETNVGFRRMALVADQQVTVFTACAEFRKVNTRA